ncbi:MAG: nitroreductase family protein [Nitrososphaeraceae archaeon]
MTQEQKDTTTKGRRSQYKINPLILNRWSPRSMTGEELNDDTIMTLFEAARWAPSSFNNQPWRFIYAKRNTRHWNIFFNLLYEGNQVWAKDALDCIKNMLIGLIEPIIKEKTKRKCHLLQASFLQVR